MPHMLKIKLIAVSASLALLTTGCGHLIADKIPTGDEMVGSWVGTSSGHEDGRSSGTNVEFLINKATGQSFSGVIKYKYRDGRSGEERINGSIGPTGAIVIADNDGFYINGSVKDGKLSLQYIESSNEEVEASNVSVTRQ